MQLESVKLSKPTLGSKGGRSVIKLHMGVKLSSLLLGVREGGL